MRRSNIECGHRTSNADIEYRIRFIEDQMRRSNIECGDRTSNADIEHRMRTSNIECVLSNIECGNRTSNAFYRIPYTGNFSRLKIFVDRWFRVFRGKYFRGLNTSTGNETSMHFTQSTSTRRLGTILGHFSRIATKTRNPRKFSTAKICQYTVFDKTHSMFDFRIRYSIKCIRYSMSAFDVRSPHLIFDKTQSMFNRRIGCVR